MFIQTAEYSSFSDIPTQLLDQINQNSVKLAPIENQLTEDSKELDPCSQNLIKEITPPPKLHPGKNNSYMPSDFLQMDVESLGAVKALSTSIDHNPPLSVKNGAILSNTYAISISIESIKQCLAHPSPSKGRTNDFSGYLVLLGAILNRSELGDKSVPFPPAITNFAKLVWSTRFCSGPIPAELFNKLKGTVDHAQSECAQYVKDVENNILGPTQFLKAS
ncbi:MAG: hypothetical protein P0S95_03115 [Rhabdochlamydiaceae bacterium]|nr:hypothetical protein [Candidatus Amphrikana amoebophyrae]